MFTLEMLPAGRGDCLWIEYGNAAAPQRILIDGGVPGTAARLHERIEEMPENERHFELLVVTHIDLDHIGGILSLITNPPAGLSFGDIWFNAWKHLPDNDDGLLGAKQGELLSHYIEKHEYPWNKAFGGQAVALQAPRELWTGTLDGGMKLTLLSPTLDRLAALKPVWEKEIEAAGLTPGEAGRSLAEEDEGLLGGGVGTLNIDELAKSFFERDKSPANGSSIAVLAEYGGKRCLLTGDAFPADLAISLGEVAARENEVFVAVDAIKLSHHGGRKNTSIDLLKKLACSRYLFSTDGSYYEHPHAETVARVVVHGKQIGKPHLFFNYFSDHNAAWRDVNVFGKRFESHYPPEFFAEGFLLNL